MAGPDLRSLFHQKAPEPHQHQDQHQLLSLLLKEQIFRSAEYEEILKSLSRDGPLPSRRLDFPVLEPPFVNRNIVIVGSCNGLICVILDFVTEESFTFMLWNPCTGEYQVLPQPPVHASRECFFGFVYDSTTDDYKVILGNSYKPGYGFVENVEYVVAVFMLKRGSWRKLERLNRYFGVSCEGCLVNEALHWVLKEKEDGWFIDLKIVSFDLAEEKFHEIPFPYPPNPSDRQGFIAQVGVLNNCLTLEFMTMGDRGGWNFQMWVLKDYGVKGSWTEVTSIPSEVVDDEYTCMACISDNGEILMQLEVAGPLALYNPKEKTYKTLMGYGGYWYETAT